eukprot:GEMP01078098.1.p1 GENE.GEMP01078098.1~~GEMP01078098.1.p1  ORF type:complete len:255 (+),score=68.32 GEMP01078098.1:64-828(+)
MSTVTSPSDDAPQVMGAPQPTVALASGMPDSDIITKQKESFAKMLEQQLKQGVAALHAQASHQASFLVAQADQQKEQFNAEVKRELEEQGSILEAEYDEQVAVLQRQAAQHEVRLEQEAKQMITELEEAERQNWWLYFARVVPCCTRVKPDAADAAKVICNQKNVYVKLTHQQVNRGIEVLDTQMEVRVKFLRTRAEQQKKQFAHLTDMEMKQQEMMLQQECYNLFMGMQEASKRLQTTEYSRYIKEAPTRSEI